jgi:chromosome segregation ATPase
MADTLLDVATEEAQKAKDEQARVGAELSEAQKDLDEAQKGLDVANDELKTLNEEAAAIRRQIAEETVSADGAKLFEDLDAKTTERRAKEAEIIALQEKLADARSRLTAGWTEAAAAAAGE